MAGFKMHVTVAAAVSVVASVYVSSLSLFSVTEIVMLCAICIIGTTLPDLDSKTSKPLVITYGILSFLIPSILLYVFYDSVLIDYAIRGVWRSIAFLVITCILFVYMFLVIMSNVRHRGVFHSVPMAAFLAVSSMNISYYFNQNTIFSFYVGLSLFLGFITHLLLDEVYSFVGMKSSFRTAFKFYDKRNVKGTIVLYVFLVLACLLSNYHFREMLFS